MSAAEVMMFFSYEHLPAHLREVSRPFCELAQSMVGTTDAVEVIDGRLIATSDAYALAAPRNTEAHWVGLKLAAARRVLTRGEGTSADRLCHALRKVLEAKDCAVRAAYLAAQSRPSREAGT